ncbi:MAG: GGDEF domain-containing protein [Fibrobacteraceae bacterium]|nr:GGDEF domain-containing protein [Fibrobacteraceae bacterium]
MLQQTYEVTEKRPLTQLLKNIATESDYRNAKSKLLLIFEPICETSHIQQILEQCKNFLPEAHLVGMTTLGPLNAKTDAQKNTVISVLLFFESEIWIKGCDCQNKNQVELGRMFRKELDAQKDVKGLLCISSCVQLCPAPFIEEIRRNHDEIPVFGAQAGTAKLVQDQSKIFVDGIIYECGIVVVSFCGKSLELKIDYNLGWIPLGHEFKVTELDNKGFVGKFDNLLALQLYKQYLNVEPDEFFYENVCSFPLLAQSKNRKIAKVPIHYTKDGRLQFSVEFKKDMHVSLSYSKPEYLLKQTLASANAMAVFRPQGLLLFACMNRRVFMGNEKAEREFAYYRHAYENLCWSYGYGEILQTSEGGGVLNSSLVAVGFREGSSKDNSPVAPFIDREFESPPSHVPLSNRLVTFLEVTSQELRESMEKMEFLAQHDPLTGIYNRRRLDEILRYELKKRRKSCDLSVLMFDIDFFKQVNDNYGHDVGDFVLKKLSEDVSLTIRTEDVFGRWGGEEFVCILSNTPVSGANVLAERIRKRIENLNLSPVPQVTISVGVTSAIPADTAESMFIRVDKALYDAKQSGKNRVANR